MDHIQPGMNNSPDNASAGLVAEKVTGAEAVLRCLLEEGIDTIFGYPGGAIMPVYDALFYYQDRINHILPRHEQGAIHAAQGFARVTRKTGVCMATSGPGATNLITGPGRCHPRFDPAGVHNRAGIFPPPWLRCLSRNGCGKLHDAGHQMEFPGH